MGRRIHTIRLRRDNMYSTFMSVLPCKCDNKLTRDLSDIKMPLWNGVVDVLFRFSCFPSTDSFYSEPNFEYLI